MAYLHKNNDRSGRLFFGPTSNFGNFGNFGIFGNFGNFGILARDKRANVGHEMS